MDGNLCFRFMSYLYCSFLLFPCGLTIIYRMKSLYSLLSLCTVSKLWYDKTIQYFVIFQAVRYSFIHLTLLYQYIMNLGSCRTYLSLFGRWCLSVKCCLFCNTLAKFSVYFARGNPDTAFNIFKFLFFSLMSLIWAKQSQKFLNSFY